MDHCTLPLGQGSEAHGGGSLKSTFGSRLFIGIAIIWVVDGFYTFYAHIFSAIGGALVGVAQHLAGR